jgi:hypothetical protein
LSLESEIVSFKDEYNFEEIEALKVTDPDELVTVICPEPVCAGVDRDLFMV